MSTVKVLYYMSQQAIDDVFVETGERMGASESVEFDAMSFSPQLRRAIIPLMDRHEIRLSDWPRLSTYVSDNEIERRGVHAYVSRTQRFHFDHFPNANEVRGKLTEMALEYELAIEEAQPRYEQWLADQEIKSAAEEDRKAAEMAEFHRQAEIYVQLLPMVQKLVSSGDDLDALKSMTYPDGYNQNFPTYRPFSTNAFAAACGDRGIGKSLSSMIRDRVKEIEDEAAESEKDKWIRSYGSVHLMRAWSAGHHCGRQYALERMARQYPGYTLDYDGDADWKERPFPSLGALDMRDDLIDAAHPDADEPEIVWLTSQPSNSDDDGYGHGDYFDFEPCEAVVFFDRLVRKWLVRIVN